MFSALSHLTTAIQSADPYFRSRPIYRIHKSSSRNVHLLPRDNPNAFGWAATDLDLRCQDYLASTGEWRGRGPAIIVNMDACRSEAEIIGTAVHEFAHHLAWLGPDPNDGKDRGFHGPQFFRAATHLTYRCNQWFMANGFAAVPIGDVFNLGIYNLTPDPGLYVLSLAEELPKVQYPIGYLLHEPPPAEFVGLCRGEALRNGWPLPYPSKESDTPAVAAKVVDTCLEPIGSKPEPTPSNPTPLKSYGELLEHSRPTKYRSRVRLWW